MPFVHICVFFSGAIFHLIKLPEANEKHAEYICRLSQDHRFVNKLKSHKLYLFPNFRCLTFEGNLQVGEEFEPVELVSISELNLLRSPDVPPGEK
jgi:hypothetical protein